MTAPSVSVVIPARDGECYLDEAIKSALDQTLPPLEVIVVDDGSTDGTAGIARRRGVRYLRRDHGNDGAARNEGIAAARGELIAFLDHDDIWEPDKLKCQVGLLRDEPEAGLVNCHMRPFLMPGSPEPRGFPPGYFGRAHATVQPSALLTRRRTFERIGPFDWSMEMSSDFDWVLRALDAGERIATVPEVLLRYRIHNSNMSWRRDVVRATTMRALRSSTARKRATAARPAEATDV